MTTILQILPAEGWIAKYEDVNGHPEPIYTAVACLALVEDDDGQRSVQPIDADAMRLGGTCADMTNYVTAEYVGTALALELTFSCAGKGADIEKPLDTPEGSTLRVIPFKKKDDDE